MMQDKKSKDSSNLVEIKTKNHKFIYDTIKEQITNEKGIVIHTKIYDIDKISENNLGNELEILFEDFEEIVTKFHNSCKTDITAGIEWTRFY